MSVVRYTPDGKPVSLENFDKVSTIGVGSFGTVSAAKYIDVDGQRPEYDGVVFALKQMDVHKLAEGNLEKYADAETNILHKVKHPYVVNLVFAFVEDGLLNLVMDYCSQGDVAQKLEESGPFDEDTVRLFACELILAVGHLHSCGISHRDLKPSNICIYANGHIALTDFGLAKDLASSNTVLKTYLGTPMYQAPDMINEIYSPAIDWWSMGVILMELLGEKPFWAPNDYGIIQLIMTAEVRYPDWLSEECKDFMSKLFVREPEKRLGYGPTGVDDIMAHPWFDTIDWKAVMDKTSEPPFDPVA